ncbi:MAG: hypothetical protein Q7U98_12070 [Methylicorpusculum sp.]|uniref:hypothetical protein n=1 Tax=Methylicorpusculum sp. TaxID=2713644 RepID=UPI00272332AE|nr:hypothetical protein [Methylicorpusculum sp.]MDO8844315.1 hypothetical protein [Methylicorpusculum sp.]MDO8939884.1 hypothetical protein [Methylicorpusculum sp.]MDP2202477.1 hypothetical protein [Methylicorpusculum sp.]
MNKTKMLNGLMFGALISVAGSAGATVVSETVIDFGGSGNVIMGLASYAGFANNTPIAGGNCAGAGAQGCIYQNNMVIGIIEDSSNSTAHLHRAGNAGNRALSYHADSPGIYMRALDGSAFSLISMDFLAPINDKNPDNGEADFWNILGFNTALNPGLDQGDGANYGTLVAYQKIANGFNGELILDPAFQNINAVWINFNGYPQTPDDGKEFELTLDNIKVGPAVVSQVPVPAAAWLFGTGLLGLISFGKKKTGLSA